MSLNGTRRTSFASTTSNGVDADTADYGAGPPSAASPARAESADNNAGVDERTPRSERKISDECAGPPQTPEASRKGPKRRSCGDSPAVGEGDEGRAAKAGAERPDGGGAGPSLPEESAPATSQSGGSHGKSLAQEASENDLEYRVGCDSMDGVNVPPGNDAVADRGTAAASSAGWGRIEDRGPSPPAELAAHAPQTAMKSEHPLRDRERLARMDDEVEPPHPSVVGAYRVFGPDSNLARKNRADQRSVVQLDDGAEPPRHSELRDAMDDSPIAGRDGVSLSGGLQGKCRPCDLVRADDEVEPLHHSAMGETAFDDGSLVSSGNTLNTLASSHARWRKSGSSELIQINDDVGPLTHSGPLAEDAAPNGSLDLSLRNSLFSSRQRSLTQVGSRRGFTDSVFAHLTTVEEGDDGGAASTRRSKRRTANRPRAFHSGIFRSGVQPSNQSADEESAPADSSGDNTSAAVADATNMDASPILEGDVDIIPEAFLVEEYDQEVIIATQLEPPLPLWKQRRARLLLVVLCAVVISLSIALGTALSLSNVNMEMAPRFRSGAPSSSASPSAEATATPSSSSAPSSSPTACAEKIATGARKVNLQHVVSPSNPVVAVDGRNMVVVAVDSGSSPSSSSSVYVSFYTLTNNGWERLERSIHSEARPIASKEYKVALSGNTAMLGLPDALEGAGILFIYEKGESGEWRKIEKPSVPADNAVRWGRSLGLDGDLACVGDRDGVSIFHRPIDLHLGKWAQLYRVNMVPHSECYVAGNIIALKSQMGSLQLYKFNRDKFVKFDQDVVSLILDPMPANVMMAALDRDHFVFTDETSVSIYVHRGEDHMFNLSQRLNYEHTVTHASIGKDVLVVGGSDHTLIFHEQNGYWKESMVLDGPYNDYKVSGQNLLATIGSDVYSFDLEDCMKNASTEVPTSSIMPTMAPCYGIYITVKHNDNAQGTSWNLQRIEEDGGTVVLSDIFHTKFLCLPEGEYNFTIHADSGDGICCGHGKGHYNLTSSNGGLIAQGGDFGYYDTTTFFIPFSSAPSRMPSLSPSHSPSSFPSLVPSISFAPSMSHMKTLFESDCDDDCFPDIAMNGHRAVVTRDNIDITFFSFTNSSFELDTMIDIDYDASALAIANDTVVVGSTEENNSAGAVYVYERDQNGIWNKMMRIVPIDNMQGALFGCSVAIDGDIMIVGARSDGVGEEGSVYIYHRIDATWIQEEKLTPIDNSTASTFGYSVSVKGNTVVVGDHHYDADYWTGHSGKGRVFVYIHDSFSNSWTKLGGDLTNENDKCKNFGSFVRLMHDEELLVGCGHLLSEDNAVYYYEKQGNGDRYILRQNIDFDFEILSMSVHGNAMVLGERRFEGSNVIRFFARKNHAWDEVNKIDERTLDEFIARRVALFGKTTLISSRTNVYILQDYPLVTTLSTATPTKTPSSLSLYHPGLNGHCHNDLTSKKLRNFSMASYESVEECCKKWFSSKQDECISASPYLESETEGWGAFAARKRRRKRRQPE